MAILKKIVRFVIPMKTQMPPQEYMNPKLPMIDCVCKYNISYVMKTTIK